MGEYVQSDAGSGGAKWGVDTISETGDNVSYPRTKLIHGADGVNAGDVCDANPLPVDDAGGSLTVDGTVSISGTVAISAASLPLPSGAATSAKQDTEIAGLASIDGHVDGIEALLGGGLPSALAAGGGLKIEGVAGGVVVPVSDGGGALTVDGTVSVTGVSTSAKQDSIIALLAGGLPAALAANGGLKIEGVAGGVVVPVSDGGGALTVDGTVSISGTVAISAASLPLPSGASTAAKQPALGTAGTASADVITVQGIASMTALKVDGSAVTQPISAASLPSHPVTNAGTFAVQVDGSALASLQLIDDVIYADDGNAFSVGSSKVAAVGFLADETASDSMDEGDVGIARMTLDRKQHVVAEIESSSMRAAGTALTPKYAIIDAATSGNNTLVSAVSSKKIRVLSAFLVAAGTVTARFESGADGTALSGQMNLVANTGFVLPFSPVGWFETAATTLLNLELSGAISVDGCLCYVEV